MSLGYPPVSYWPAAGMTAGWPTAYVPAPAVMAPTMPAPMMPWMTPTAMPTLPYGIPSSGMTGYPQSLGAAPQSFWPSVIGYPYSQTLSPWGQQALLQQQQQLQLQNQLQAQQLAQLQQQQRAMGLNQLSPQQPLGAQGLQGGGGGGQGQSQGANPSQNQPTQGGQSQQASGQGGQSPGPSQQLGQGGPNQQAQGNQGQQQQNPQPTVPNQAPQQGTQGLQGPPGQNGQPGSPGQQGPPGQNGQNGQPAGPGNLPMPAANTLASNRATGQADDLSLPQENYPLTKAMVERWNTILQGPSSHPERPMVAREIAEFLLAHPEVTLKGRPRQIMERLVANVLSTGRTGEESHFDDPIERDFVLIALRDGGFYNLPDSLVAILQQLAQHGTGLYGLEKSVAAEILKRHQQNLDKPAAALLTAYENRWPAWNTAELVPTREGNHPNLNLPGAQGLQERTGPSAPAGATAPQHPPSPSPAQAPVAHPPKSNAKGGAKSPSFFERLFGKPSATNTAPSQASASAASGHAAPESPPPPAGSPAGDQGHPALSAFG